MWKRDEAVRPSGSGGTTGHEGGSGSLSAPARRTTGESGRSIDSTAANIGKSVAIKGELIANEDCTIEGQIEGKIDLREHELTIGSNGKVKAQVVAKSVIVAGEVTGDITATDKISIQANGSVDGDITAPRVAIEAGAHFRGSIDMQRSQAAKLVPPAQAEVNPAVAPGARRTS